MTLPTISIECFLAHLSKATQQSPDKFAGEFLTTLTHEQPELAAGILAMVRPILDNGIHGEDTLTSDQAAEMCLMTTFCILGIVMECISAQIDADEMEEVWS